MSFLDEGQFANPFAALERLGGCLAQSGASVEDMVAAAEQCSHPVDSQRDTRNLQALAQEIHDKPDLIRQGESPGRLWDIDDRVADRIMIAETVGKLSITQAEQGE